MMQDQTTKNVIMKKSTGKEEIIYKIIGGVADCNSSV